MSSSTEIDRRFRKLQKAMISAYEEELERDQER